MPLKPPDCVTNAEGELAKKSDHLSSPLIENSRPHHHLRRFHPPQMTPQQPLAAWIDSRTSGVDLHRLKLLLISHRCRSVFGWKAVQVVVVVMGVQVEIALDDQCKTCNSDVLDFRLLGLGRDWRLGAWAGGLFGLVNRSTVTFVEKGSVAGGSPGAGRSVETSTWVLQPASNRSKRMRGMAARSRWGPSWSRPTWGRVTPLLGGRQSSGLASRPDQKNLQL